MRLRRIARKLAEGGNRVAHQRPCGLAVDGEAGEPLEAADVQRDLARRCHGEMRGQELDMDAVIVEHRELL